MPLKAESIRIQRIPGKALIGIEVPNKHRETIQLRDVVESKKFRESDSLLTLAVGKTIDGLNYVADLAMMPHLLIAGVTGAGKSVSVNSFVVSILYKAKPDEVKFIMVDPKRLELGVYADIPHLATPIITDPKRAAVALRWAVSEMERRYKYLAGWGVRNIDGYNIEAKRRNKAKQFDENGEPHPGLPFIVIIIDELADLMMVSGKEVEEAITRLTEMARAAGIHLILTTVKPLSEVMTREMKANFNTRIAFRTASHADSKSIIEVTGAEDLLMGSDMLFLPSASKEPIRIHGAFVDEKEIARIVEHVKAQGEALFDDTITKTEEELDDSGDLPGKRDPLFWDAVKSVVHAKRASTSLLQRHLRIGYGRAAAILDEMVKEGYIGDMDGSSRARPVLQCAYDDLQNLSDMAELVVIPKSTNSELIKTNTETKGIQKRLTGGVLSRTKICTTCHAIYKDNDLKFCLSDGTTLVWTGKDASLAHLIANIDARLATRVLTTIAIISLLVTMGSCVGCYASTASTYSQYDGKYGNPHDQLTFASVMGLAFLVLCITSVAALFFGISEDQRPKPTNSNVAHIKMLFKLFAWTTVISAVMSLGGCVGFIVTRPPPGDFSSVVVDYGKQTFLPFAYTAFFAYLIYLGALIGTFRNYYPSISKDR